MRKKFNTRFPATKIKKIMRVDKDMWRIATTTPLLISKALELFLQDLCDRTYEITFKNGAKTVNSHHLKEAAHTHPVFDFLKEIVAHVADLEAEAGGSSDTGYRRKAPQIDKDGGHKDDAKKQSRSECLNCRGRSRERGPGKSSGNERARNAKNGNTTEDNEASSLSSPPLSEVCSNSSNTCEGGTRGADKSPETHTQCPREFDLNVELNENGEVAGKEVKQGFQPLETGLAFGHIQNVFQEEDDYDAEDE